MLTDHTRHILSPIGQHTSVCIGYMLPDVNSSDFYPQPQVHAQNPKGTAFWFVHTPFSVFGMLWYQLITPKTNKQTNTVFNLGCQSAFFNRARIHIYLFIYLYNNALYAAEFENVLMMNFTIMNLTVGWWWQHKHPPRMFWLPFVTKIISSIQFE